MLLLFISYSRRDVAIAEMLLAALEAEGFEVRIDRRDLPYGEEWQAELADFIRAADTVLWLVSPASIASKWCRWELGEVSRLNKRLVPLVIAEFDRSTLPEALGRIHLLPAEGLFALSAHLLTLVNVLKTDHAWIKEHTRLSDWARQWLAKERDGEFLLRGAALRDAEVWTEKRRNAAPPPTGEILELILTSRRAATKRQRWTMAGALAVAALSVGLAITAYWQRHVADAQRKEVQLTQSRFLADASKQKTEDGDATAGLLLALEALPDAMSPDDLIKTRPYWSPAEVSLEGARRALQQRSVLIGHQGPITSVVITADGTRVITGSADNTARIWDARTGRELMRLGHKKSVTAVAVTANAARVVTGSEDKRARMWDAKTGELLMTFSEHEDAITSVAATPDGKHIVTGSTDQSVRIWDASTGRELRKMTVEPGFQHGRKQSPGYVYGVSITSDGQSIAIATDTGSAQIRDATSGELRLRLSGHTGEHYPGLTYVQPPVILGIAATPDGAVVVTGANDKTARVWEAKTGKELVPPLVHEQPVTSIAVTPDGARVVTGSGDKIARIWSTKTGKELAHFVGHQDSLSSVAITADGMTVVTGSADRTARIWDARTSVERAELIRADSPIRAVAATADGRIVIGEQRPTEQGTAWKVRLIDVITGLQDSKTFLGPEDLRGVSVTSDGGTILILTSWRGAQIWDVKTGKVEAVSEALGLGAIAPNGARFVTSSNETADVWDTKTRQKVSLVGHDKPITSVVFTADGTRVITGSEDNTARIWDAKSGRELVKLIGHSQPVTSVAATANAARIVTGSEDKTARVWDAKTGKVLRVLAGHASAVTCVAVAWDETRIVSGSRDKTARVWNAATGQEIARLGVHQQPITTVAVLHKGKSLITGSEDQTVRIWKMPLWGQALVDEAKEATPSCLTPGQRERYYLPSTPPSWCRGKWPYTLGVS